MRKSRRKKPKVVMMDVGEKDAVDSEQRVYRRRRRRRRAGGKSGSANGERVVRHPARCLPRDVPGPQWSSVKNVQLVPCSWTGIAAFEAHECPIVASI